MRLILAAFLGGVLGTSLRFAADVAVPHTTDQFPTGTLLVNVLGAAALGWLVGGLWTRPAVPAWLKVALGPGVLGSFTTFSAVMVSLVAQGAAGLWTLAVGYLAASVVLGFAAAALGLWLGRLFDERLTRRRDIA
ncbi:CrcB family protein [Cryobacterium melibiosiphilum]|uniref:Fluoride-specific ion channel FluC n=1 Tax=Cryobacterium melibiosiphilum TaxID=995039 RepID=A0A3A5MJK0_9MICO|nr:CrcB family protein [Cryobacterium melibiosiphilum]RJT89081.1 CrcB family protein [Cryobacterium melibiosiphilum]